MRANRVVGLVLALSVVLGGLSPARGQDASEDGIGLTPPRLSLVEGQVSFWRPGASDWVQAQVNTPLAPGDLLYTGSQGTVELQVAPRAFVRASGGSQLGLENHEPDFLQFKVTAGSAIFDLRALEPGRAVEVGTPNAAFTIEHPGYYRLAVAEGRTSFTTRRSGRATAILANGNSVVVTASEELLVEGIDNPQPRSYAAPPLDEWDRWNYARTDDLLDAVSARYVAPGTFGVDDLDRHGTWRVVDTYGPVWVPTAVSPGWAPYSAGSWVLDPVYGWTWIDSAPWGWAPFHHGRWVFVNGYWAWAPGPIIARPVYAPALVAFFGGSGVRVGVGIPGPVLGWVALGWGEPCVPWWGRPGFVRHPWWGGWGGPRVVNNVIVHRTTIVDVNQIAVYRNAGVRNAVLAVHEDRFGRGRIAPSRVPHAEVHGLRPIPAAPAAAGIPANFVPTNRRGIRPSDDGRSRPVVATRPPHRSNERPGDAERRDGVRSNPEPAPRLVTPSAPRDPGPALNRPPFGKSPVERPMSDRRQPPLQPGIEGASRGAPDHAEVSQARTAPSQPSEKPIAPKPGPAGKGSAAPAQPVAPPPASAGRPAPEKPRADHERQPAPPPAAAPQGRLGPVKESRPPEAQAAPRTQGSPPSPKAPPASASVPAQPPSRPATSEPAPSGRAEAAKPSNRPLPGEPASRLAPHRVESKPPQPPKSEAAPPKGRPNGAPGRSPMERPEPQGSPGRK